MSTRITGISSMATRALLADLADAWRLRFADVEVQFESVGGVDAARRVNEGERFDVVVLAADAIDKLAANGRIVPGSQVELVYSPVAVAVKRGAARPAIASEAELRSTVLAAQRLGYSTGPSGVALLKLFERWGVLDAIRSRLVQAPPGVAVGALLERGDVDLGFQQLSELMHVDGVDVLGPMPPGLEIVTTFSGAIAAASQQHDRARALLAFLQSPDADDAKRRHGMQPASRKFT